MKLKDKPCKITFTCTRDIFQVPTSSSFILVSNLQEELLIVRCKYKYLIWNFIFTSALIFLTTKQTDCFFHLFFHFFFLQKHKNSLTIKWTPISGLFIISGTNQECTKIQCLGNKRRLDKIHTYMFLIPSTQKKIGKEMQHSLLCS